MALCNGVELSLDITPPDWGPICGTVQALLSHHCYWNKLLPVLLLPVQLILLILACTSVISVTLSLVLRLIGDILCGGRHLGVLRGYSWLFSQELILAGLTIWDAGNWTRISCEQDKCPTCCVMAPVTSRVTLYIIFRMFSRQMFSVHSFVIRYSL